MYKLILNTTGNKILIVNVFITIAEKDYHISRCIIGEMALVSSFDELVMSKTLSDDSLIDLD